MIPDAPLIVLIPTGDEVVSGLIIDTDSPAIMGEAIRRWPGSSILRHPPVKDEEDVIKSAVKAHVEAGAWLVVVIGGSGGGHRFTDTLAPDYSCGALKGLFPGATTGEVWGSNGHLFSAMSVSRHAGGWAINVPGPQAEAMAAFKAAADGIEAGRGPEEIAGEMAAALAGQYPDADVSKV